MKAACCGGAPCISFHLHASREQGSQSMSGNLEMGQSYSSL